VVKREKRSDESPIVFIWVLNILPTIFRLDSEKRNVGLNLKYFIKKFLKATG